MSDIKNPAVAAPAAHHVHRAARVIFLASALALSLTVSGCITKSHTHGYVVTRDQLEQVPIGSSREQVLLVLGTPSTSATISGEAFYYISQTTEQTVFLHPSVIDQRVLAVYFDKEKRVREIGNYGLKDGRVFDFLNRRTRTGGADYGFLSQLFQGIGRVNF